MTFEERHETIRTMARRGTSHRDIAAALSVSTATVRRALAGAPNWKPAAAAAREWQCGTCGRRQWERERAGGPTPCDDCDDTVYPYLSGAEIDRRLTDAIRRLEGETA